MNIEKKIENNLRASFIIHHLDIENQSSMHKKSANSETHFKIIIVSDEFKKQSLLKRHKIIYQCLTEEMKIIHALSLQTFTINEWEQNKKIYSTPNCLHKIH